MLCTVSKTKHGRVHRKNNLPPPPHQHFFQAVFDAWWRIVGSCEGECVWYIQGQLDFTICCVRYFFSGPANRPMLWGISSAGARQKERKKKLHLNKPSSAVSRVGGCAHWITTLLLLHSIKSDSSSERGSWFDTFLLKQIWRKWGCGWAGALVQSHLFILYGSHGPKQVLMMSWLSASLILKGHFPYLEVVSITWWVQFPISHKTAWVILTIYLGKDDLTVL